MEHATFFISQTQYDWLADQLPEPPSKTKQAIPNNELLNGILFVLKTGCRWQDIPSSVCVHGYSSCWRRLRFWQKHRHLKLVWQRILLVLDNESQLDLCLGNLDGFTRPISPVRRCGLRQPAPPLRYQHFATHREEWFTAREPDIQG